MLFHKRQKKVNCNKDVIITVAVDISLVLTVIGILMVTLFPARWGVDNNIQLVPLVSIYDVLFNSVDISVPICILGFNILLFIPFGFFMAWEISSFNLARRTLFIGTSLSIVVEILQFLLPIGRIANVDDVILNTIGTLMGLYGFVLLRNFFPKVFLEVKSVYNYCHCYL
jgi:glycopeptide antibiotics resistance protein